MASRTVVPWCIALLVVTSLLVLSACAPSAAPAPAATAAPSKPAAAQPSPAAQAAKPAAKTIELRIGTSQVKGSVLADGQDKFAELINQKSKGELNARVFYQSLGIEQQLLQSVQTGSVDIGQISNGNASRFTNAFFVYDLPFLFKTYPNMLKTLNSPASAKLISQFEQDAKVKLLYILSNGGGRDVQTRNKPLKTPADIKGLKIRTVSTPVDLATFKAWGANPTPIDYAQTYTALQQGVVDGMQSTLEGVLNEKLYEVVKHDLRIDYQMLFSLVFIYPKLYDSLSPAHQKVLTEAASEAAAWQHQRAADVVAKAAQELTSKGYAEVYTPTPDEYAQWASIREQVWQSVAQEQQGKIDLALAKQLYESQ